MSLHAVILAGGSGTRFWPASRKALPKQLLPLGPDPDEPLLRATLRRLLPLCGNEHVLIATGRHLEQQTRDALPELPPPSILAEPLARNTAPCIAWANARIARNDPDAVVMVFPADHTMTDEPAFRDCVIEATRLASKGFVTTIGLAPTRPETGYGYIEVGDSLQGRAHRVSRFVEKPDLARATSFVEGGRHLWNGGMFFFRAGVMQEAIAKHLPTLHQGVAAIVDQGIDKGPAEAFEQAFAQLPSISIDHGIIEKLDPSQIAVVRGDFGWNDVGSWQSAYELAAHDAQGNAGHEGAVFVDARGNLVRSLGASAGRVVALVGVDDLVVIDTDDALLVMPRSRAQDVRLVVEQLSKRGNKAL